MRPGKGKVVLSVEAWSLAADRCKGMPRGTRCVGLESVLEPLAVSPVRPVPMLQAEAGVAAFVPAAVTERLAAGQTEWLSEALAAYARVFPIARPRSLLCQGLLASLHGNEDKAHEAFERLHASHDVALVRALNG